MASKADNIKKIAEDHWKYTGGVIKAMVAVVGYIYKKAFIHGYKHGKADK